MSVQGSIPAVIVQPGSSEGVVGFSSKVRTRRGNLLRLCLGLIVAVVGAFIASVVVTPLSAMAITNPPQAFIRTTQTLYAYVAVGENLDVIFNKVAMEFDDNQGVTITIRPVGAPTQSCTNTHAAALGSRCTFTDLTAPSSGVWAIDFTANSSSLNADRYSWLITVQNGTTTVPGRVFTENYKMRQAPGTADFTFTYVTDTGFQYAAHYRGYNGIDSSFRGDSVGVRHNGGCVSAHQSVDTSSSVMSATELGECGAPYKIFFETPNTDLPSTAIKWDGTTDWLRPAIAEQPTVTDLMFVPQADNSRSGQITFSIDGLTGAASVEIDTDNNGIFTDANDRSLPTFVSAGVGATAFDGLDGAGNPLLTDKPIGVRVSFNQIGEAHFVEYDAELRGGGLEITPLNGPSAAKTLYWDDSHLAVSGRCSVTSPLQAGAGVDSSGGAHAWGPASCSAGGLGDADSRAWGDGRSIDDWTYHALSGSAQITVPADAVPALTVTKRSNAGDSVEPGNTVTYTITIENTGDVDYTTARPASFEDTLTDVVDDATYNNDAISAPQVGSLSYKDAVLRWSGPLVMGDAVTVTYTIKVNASITGNGNLINTVTGPPESNCTTGTEVGCTTTTPVRALRIIKTSTTEGTLLPGETVSYTIKVTNIGQAPYTNSNPAKVTDDLTDVLDDASYDMNATTTPETGTINYVEPALNWAGPLDPTASVELRYTVTINNSITGDGVITNRVTGPPESNCTDGAPECTTTDKTHQPILEIDKRANKKTPLAVGDTVTYTVTATNTGDGAFTSENPATVVDDLSDVLDNGTYNKDATASRAGLLSYQAPQLVWSGPLAVGQTVMIEYTVTVTDNKDQLLENIAFQPPPTTCTAEQCNPHEVPPSCVNHRTPQSRPCDTVTLHIQPQLGTALASTGAEPAMLAAAAAAVVLTLGGMILLLIPTRRRNNRNGTV